MAASPLRLNQADQAWMPAAKLKRCCQNNRQMTYGSELTSWSNAYSNGVDTKWPRAIPCIFFSMDNLRRNGIRATIREDDVTVRISLCEGILPEASSECAALGGDRIPSTHHPQPHWNSICCSRVNNRASWNRCRPRSIPLMLVNWLGAETHLGYAEGHLIWPQHGRKQSCATAAGMCGLRSQ